MDRWEVLERTYNTASELRGEARARYLAEACCEDRAMRGQIEALLAHADTPESLLDRPAAELAAGLMTDTDGVTLNTGRRIGPYEIVELIGGGGMGHVYRARDLRLARDVALKVLPPYFVADSDRLARFRREAQTLASVNHPNIAAIYGLEQTDGVHALVLELVEGETLAARLRSGAIPFSEASRIALQIASALEAAHGQGIVHRDLKPSNITIRSDGTVKVLDFGLAKALVPVPSDASVTASGIVVGTSAYMSPEQARGVPADKRSDVWAFGCVFYEMLTGRRAFGSDDVTDTLASVLRDHPDWTVWPPLVPAAIRALVESCLEKDRNERIADISTARFVLSGRTPESGAVFRSPFTPFRRHAALTAIVAAATAIGVVAGWTLNSARSPEETAITRFAIEPPEGERLRGEPSLAISPDGKQLVYATGRMLYVRSLSELEPRPLVGTENAEATRPVFSPDSRFVAFWSRVDRAIKKIAIGGGAAVTICEADTPVAISWDADGLLFDQVQRGIMRVSPEGGTPQVLVRPAAGDVAYAAHWLPGRRALLFTLASGALLDKPRLVVQRVSAPSPDVLIEGASDGRYVPTGHIVYAAEGRLFGVPFDSRNLRVRGVSVRVLDGVARTALTAAGTLSGVAQWSVSETGSMVFYPGPPSVSSYLYSFAAVDRTGRTEPLHLPAGAYESPRISPDGRLIAFATNNGESADVWTYDLAETTGIRRFTFDGNSRFPVWSPDSRYIAFESGRGGAAGIFRQPTDSSGVAERLTTAGRNTVHVPESWSAQHQVLSFSVHRESRYSLWILSLRDKQVSRFGAWESDIPTVSTFSPNGRWIAYQVGTASGESGGFRLTTFVEPFPRTGAIFEIPGNATSPVWSADGTKLSYTIGPPNQRVVVDVTEKPAFAVGIPTAAPNGAVRIFRPDWWRHYDLGRHDELIGLVPSEKSLTPGTKRPLYVVLHWFDELKRRVPVH